MKKFTLRMNGAARFAKRVWRSLHFSHPFNISAVTLLLLGTAWARAGTLEPAVTPVLGWGYSVGYGVQWVFGINGTRAGDGWSGWFDPPANVISGQITLSYDPSLITVIPSLSGPAGLFSDNPASAPAVNASNFYGSFQVASLPNPRPGDIWNLQVLSNTVILTFDLSANPVSLDPTAGPVNFYALTFETNSPQAGFLVNDTDTGQLHEVGGFGDQSQTYMTCAAPGGATYSCGETTSTEIGFGLTAIPIPEPFSLALVGSGLAGFGLMRRRTATRALRRTRLS